MNEKCVCMFSKMAASRYKMTPDLGNVYFERDGVGTAGPRTALSLLGAFAKSDTPPSLPDGVGTEGLVRAGHFSVILSQT